MNIIQKIINSSNLLIAYKLLHDLLALLLLTIAGIFVLDGLLPGLASSRISFGKIFLLLLANIYFIIFLGEKLQINYPTKKINKHKILPFLILFAFLIIGNSLLLFTLWQNIIITLVTLFIFYLFHELFFISKD